MKPKSLKSVKPRILELDGRELDEALEKIVESHPNKRIYSDKEDMIITRLHGQVVNREIAKLLGRSYDGTKAHIATLRAEGKIP